MFDWLLKRLRTKPPTPPVPTIRTMDDLFAAIKSGAIKPHFYREGDVQVADFFAETGLSQRERTKVMLRTTHSPAGIRVYVHLHCTEAYLAKLPAGQTIDANQTEDWSPTDLIGRYRDVTHCDQCAQEFVSTDKGYRAFWIVSQEELELLEEVLREESSP